MAYKPTLTLLLPLLLTGCSSLDHADDNRPNRLRPDETFIRSPWPDPYYNKKYYSKETRRAISEQLRADRLEARGRRDNSTDSGDGFGQSLPNGYFN